MPVSRQAVRHHAKHILAETLAVTPEEQILVDQFPNAGSTVYEVALDDEVTCALSLTRSAN